MKTDEFGSGRCSLTTGAAMSDDTPEQLLGRNTVTYGVDTGMVDHLSDLSKDLSLLLSLGKLSDVTFVLDGRKFEAHRTILAARCQYFHALLFGGMKESTPNAEIELPDTSAEAFGILLEYIYSGKVMLSKLTEQVREEAVSFSNYYSRISKSNTWTVSLATR